MNSLKPQTKLVLEYLNAGRRVTPLLAITNLGVASLTKRIAELRELGAPIKDAWKEDHFGRRYKEYWLDESDRPWEAGAAQ